MGNLKKTLVLGASWNPARYSHIAIHRLRAAGHPVLGLGRRKARVSDVEIETSPFPIEDLDTITLYMNAMHQREFYDYILSLHPRRVIFNPGAENSELAALLAEKGIASMEACTLVMLATGQY